jgi:hypothetical protein
MGALVNVFKSVFGGILGFFGGLFAKKESSPEVKSAKVSKPKKGKDGFYMEASADQLEALPTKVALAVTDAPEAKKGGKKGKGTPVAAMKAAPAKVMSPEELINAALAAVAKAPEGSAEAVAAQAATLGFAEQNMIPTLTSGRRPPGPSLSAFKAMAKEIRA